MAFTVLELIRGKDLVQKEQRLKRHLTDAKEAIETNDIKFLKVRKREKRVLKTIFSGLGLPHGDAGVNGFVVGYSQDVIDDNIEKN